MDLFKKYWLAIFVFFLPVLVGAINITVPSAPASGYYLLSTSTGAYISTSTVSSLFSAGTNLYWSGNTLYVTTTPNFATTTLDRLIFPSFSAHTDPVQIYADNDSNTGIHFAGPDVFAIHAGGNERIIATTIGVGIATTTPAYSLDVDGTFRASATSTFSGNVGIGTSTPSTKLEIVGDLTISATTTPVGRLVVPMGELSVFASSGVAIAVSAQSDGLSNMVPLNTTTTLSSGSYQFTDGSGKLTYTGSTTKMFHVAATLSIAPDTANDLFVIGLAKNGTVVPESRILQQVTTMSNTEAFAFHQMVEMAFNDYIEVYIGNMSDTDDLVLKTLNIFALGM